jgi:hypothetical protein
MIRKSEYDEVIKSYGIRIINERQRKHRVLTLQLPDGTQRNVVLSCSSRSVSGMRNFESLIKRMVRGGTK